MTNLTIYARVDSGTVAELITPPTNAAGSQIPVQECHTPEFVTTLVDITNVSPQPKVGWTYNGSTFAQPSGTASW